LRLHGEGSVDQPSVGGDLQLYEFKVGDRNFGDLALVVNTVDNTVYLAGAALPLATLEVEVPLDADSPYYLRMGMEALDLSETVAEVSNSPVVSRALVTGMVELFVEKDFSRYQILSYLTKLEIDTLGRTIKNRGPLVFGLNNGEVFQIQQATIGTGDRYVSVEGAVITDPVLVDLKVDGQIDLSMLNTLRRAVPAAFPAAFIESTGALNVDASFRGAPDSLIADGRVGFRSAEVALRGLSDPLRVESGEVQLGRDRIFVTEDEPLSGTALGGVFSVAGELLFQGRRPQSLDVRAWSHNMNYRVPNTANLTFETDVKFEARDVFDPETWLVSGNVDVLDGNFYRDISLVEQEVTGRVLGAFNRRTERYEASIFDQVPALQDIRFDLGVRARDGFVIRNQIDRLGLDLELRVDVRLQDTLAEPYVTGDVEVVDGLVGFQGEEFQVRSGTVRFSGEPSNPWIDVTAGADVRNRCRENQLADDFQTDMTLSGNSSDNQEQYYHIMLNLQGYADNLDIQFESNPYADQRDILSLLLTGCTVDQLTASSASGPTLEIALGPLLGRIEKEIQDVVKVSEFTIMPGVERTQVRIGDRLTRRLSWNFQLDTGISDTAGGQRSQLEYKLSDRWSAELSGERNQTETNNFLLDLKLKYRLPLE
jgi:autotransporter translocation and assembly factor TamB